MAMEVKQDVVDKLSAKSLDRILRDTVETIETNKSQIFEVYEAARDEVEASKKSLEEIKSLTRKTIDVVDSLEKVEQREKQKLVQVSSNFADYSEERIKASYESVKNVQVELGIAREKENQLRKQRDKLELRLRSLKSTLERAEHLAMCIGSVLGYLSSQLNGVVWQIEAAQKNKFLGAQVIKAQEEERFRVSREIHDGPAQDMANLLFQASICERMIDIDPDEAKRNLQELRQQIRGCLTDIRQIIFDMRPMSLDDLGLVPAIQQLLSKMREREILDTSLNVEGEERKLVKHVEVSIFRIIQEALNNVNRHAGVKHARVRMLFTEAALSVLIVDEGKGFDMEAMENPVEPEKETADGADDETESTEETRSTETGDSADGHYGILGMQERAGIIGADLSVVSAPGKGTRVHLRLPLKKGENTKDEK